MEIINSPDPIDEPNLIYKLQRKLKVFNEISLPNHSYNLVATSSKYGLAFIGNPASGFSVYYLRDLIDKACASPPHVALSLPEPPAHLAVSCDHELLAVVATHHIYFYNVANFQNENNAPLSVRCNEDPRVRASCVQWNPCQPDTVAAALSDGSLLVCQLKGADVSLKKIPAKARCLCWSPKGKQLVSGNADGTLTQYKPELTAVKGVAAPHAGGAPLETLAVQWLSNYQFAAVYRNSADDSRPYVAIVNTPKGGPAVCINYEDVCYSMGSARPWSYYLHSVAQWGILMAASSNSVEVATLGSSDGTNWVQWCQLDEAKPELPLTDKKQDNYPIGLAFDTAALHQLPWGESETLPPMPLLLVLSHTGLLATFNAVNLRPGAPQICEPPHPLALPPSLLRADAVETPAPPPAAAPPAPAPAPAPAPSLLVESRTFVPGPAAAHSFAAQPPAATYGQLQPNASYGQDQRKPASDLVSQPQSKPPPAVQSVSAPQSQPPEASDAHAPPKGQKSEELRAATARANEEMTEMLVKLVNNFQAELYEFLQKSRDVNLEVNMSTMRELSERLREQSAAHVAKECSLESLHAALAELKLDVVRTCALLAEARSRAGSEDPDCRRQVEPMCARAAESVRRQLCRVQSRLQQAEDIMHHKWGEVYARFQHTDKRGDRMATPALDAVYRPLVRQQEILSRQRAVLRTLQRTLQETTGARGSMLKGFKDPLSKLTKNVLNMSLEEGSGGGGGGGGRGAAAGGGLSAHKLEALKELLANHKTTRVKSVNTEVQRHLASMQQAHERLLREMRELRAGREAAERRAGEREPMVQTQVPATKHEPPSVQREAPLHKQEWIASKVTPAVPKDPVVIQKVVPAVRSEPPQANVLNWAQDSPGSYQRNVLNWAQQQMATAAGSGNTVTITAANIANVAKNLFANNEAPNFEIKSSAEFERAAPKQSPADKNIPTSNADSIIVGLLQNKSNLQFSNTFMGQKICSPTTTTTPFGGSMFSAFTPKPAVSVAAGSKPNGAATQSLFGADSKPFAFPPQQTKPFETQSGAPKSTELAKALADIKSAETGETDSGGISVPKPSAETSQAPATTTSTPAASIFGGAASSPPPAAAQDAAPPPAPGTQPSTLSAASVFSSAESAAAATGPASGSPKPTAPAPVPASPSATSVFGATNTAVPTTTPAAVSAGSIFGTPPASSAPLFGPASPSASKAASVFGAASPTASTAAPVFGAASPTAVTAASVFGGSSPTASTATSVFGSTSTASTAGSVFGGTPAAAGTATSVFGAASPVGTAASVFGTSAAAPVFGATSPAASVFGGTSPTGGAASVFGGTAPAPGSPASVFGAPQGSPGGSIFGAQPDVSVFGKPAAQSPQSVFGAPAAGGSVFGAGDPVSLFGAVSISPASAAPAQPGNVFAGSSGGSVFGGGGGGVFGAAPAFGQAGSPAPAQSVFGGSPAFGQQKPAASVFGGGASFGSSFSSPPQTTQASSIFGGGGGGGGFGGAQPAFGSGSPASQSIFGTPEPQKQAASVFGSPQQSAPGFGGGAVFGSKPVFGQQTGFGSPTSGAFSSGFSGGTVAASGFGSPPAFGSKSPGGGFGAAPVFGGAPAFGAGGFGTGSPPKVFGGSSPAGFGAPMQQSSTFENLAGQNTLSFGNLAQQSPQPPAFNTSPSFSGWRG